MSDKEFIREFLKIKISTICKELNIDPTNVYNLTASKDKLKRIRDILESEIKRLYEKD